MISPENGLPEHVLSLCHSFLIIASRLASRHLGLRNSSRDGARQALGTVPRRTTPCPWAAVAWTAAGLHHCLSLEWQCQGVKLPFCCALHSSLPTF